MSSISLDDVEPGFYRDLMTWTEMPLPSKQEALDFLGAMNEINYDCGDWNKALVMLALKSDVGNRRKLRREFGGLVSAVVLYKEHDNGFALLWKIADMWEHRPTYLRCLAGVDRLHNDEEFCRGGLSCANLGVNPWTSKGCPLA